MLHRLLPKKYDYLYIPKAFMKEEPFKAMTASTKIMYALLMEKQQKSVEMGWIDEKDHVYILANVIAIGAELNWDETEALAAVEELERFGLVEIIEKSEDLKLYLDENSLEENETVKITIKDIKLVKIS